MFFSRVRVRCQWYPSSCNVIPWFHSLRLCPCLTFLCVFTMLVSLLRVLSFMNPVTCLGTALSRVCACAASSRVTWPEIVRSPGVRPVPVLLCLLRLRLFSLLSLCRPSWRLRRHLYPLPLSRLRLCNPFCHPLLSRPLLCLHLCYLSSLRNLLLLKMERFLSSDHSEADASPPRRPRPRVASLVDYRQLVRLVLPKVKLGSDLSTVKKLCLSMVKVHKLKVSDDECARVAASVCSNS